MRLFLSEYNLMQTEEKAEMMIHIQTRQEFDIFVGKLRSIPNFAASNFQTSLQIFQTIWLQIAKCLFTKISGCKTQLSTCKLPTDYMCL